MTQLAIFISAISFCILCLTIATIENNEAMKTCLKTHSEIVCYTTLN